MTESIKNSLNNKKLGLFSIKNDSDVEFSRPTKSF